MVLLEIARNMGFGREEPIWTAEEALKWIKRRVWVDPKEALEWILTHQDEIHAKAMVSCVDYSPTIELGIFNAGCKALTDGEEVTK